MYVLALALTLATPRPVGMAEAIRLAEAHNHDVAASRAQAGVAAATVGRADSAWLPEVTATATYDHTTAPQALDYGSFVGLVGGVFGLTPRNAQIVPPPLTLQASDSLFGTLQVSQPLFSPQGLFAKKPAKEAAEAAALATGDVREAVALEVARTYLVLEGARELVVAAQHALAVAKTREQEARADIEAGGSTHIALLRAQTETAQAERQIAALRAAHTSGEAALAALVGEPITITDGPPTRLSYPALDAAAAPWRSTYAVRTARAQSDAARSAIRVDRFAYLPTVAAVARGSYNSNTGFYGTNVYADALLTMTVPIYDRGVRDAAAAEDRARSLVTIERLRAVEARSEATWRSAAANVEAARADLAAAESQAELSVQAQAEVENLWKSGLATNLEVSSADSQRFLAESAAAQARATLEVRRAELAAAEGRLVETADGQR